jgi:hypothetical protein
MAWEARKKERIKIISSETSLKIHGQKYKILPGAGAIKHRDVLCCLKQKHSKFVPGVF